MPAIDLILGIWDKTLALAIKEFDALPEADQTAAAQRLDRRLQRIDQVIDKVLSLSHDASAPARVDK